MHVCKSRTAYVWVTSTRTMHDAISAMENKKIDTSYLLPVTFYKVSRGH